jgi:hypothetical protein
VQQLYSFVLYRVDHLFFATETPENFNYYASDILFWKVPVSCSMPFGKLETLHRVQLEEQHRGLTLAHC